jgi:hypothetical protein
MTRINERWLEAFGGNELRLTGQVGLLRFKMKLAGTFVTLDLACVRLVGWITLILQERVDHRNRQMDTAVPVYGSVQAHHWRLPQGKSEAFAHSHDMDTVA